MVAAIVIAHCVKQIIIEVFYQFLRRVPIVEHLRSPPVVHGIHAAD